jgi:hypothetical protein
VPGGPTPPLGTARAWVAPSHGMAGSWPPPTVLSSGLRFRFGKTATSAFVSSNFENISCTSFLKYKNSRKQGTDTMASC